MQEHRGRGGPARQGGEAVQRTQQRGRTEEDVVPEVCTELPVHTFRSFVGQKLNVGFEPSTCINLFETTLKLNK